MTNLIKVGLGIGVGIVASFIFDKVSEKISNKNQEVVNEEDEINPEEYLDEETIEKINDIRKFMRIRLVIICTIRFILMCGLPMMLIYTANRKSKQYVEVS